LCLDNGFPSFPGHYLRATTFDFTLGKDFNERFSASRLHMQQIARLISPAARDGAKFPSTVTRIAWQTLRRAQTRSVLDLGAGTGRIGKAFVQAADSYIGVDSSLKMLREFAAQCPVACLIQADGQALPFPDCTFDLVLLMQVLSGAASWSNLLCEALRVVSRPGAILVGNTVATTAGIDAQLKRQLSTILESMGVAMHEPKKSKEGALVWLRARCSEYKKIAVAHWAAERSAEQFIARHRTGARFAALSAGVQEEALGRLSTWAEATFGTLNKRVSEDFSFILDVFKIQPPRH
jgi:SAM-dependent methyltransferase